MKTFGTLISEARRSKGLSQKDLAAKVKKEKRPQLVTKLRTAGRECVEGVKAKEEFIANKIREIYGREDL